MKIIYAIDEYGPIGPIPNSIGMSHYEYISHYTASPIKKGLNFYYQSDIHLNLGIEGMYAHHSDILNNLEYYSSQGTIVYIINIHHNIKYIASLYYGSGRGAWTEYIPDNIITLWKKGKCKIIISHNWANCDIHTINRVFLFFYKKFNTCRDFYLWTTSIHNPKVLSLLNPEWQKNIIHLPYAEIWSLKNLPQYQTSNVDKEKKFIKLSRRYTMDRLLSHVTFTKEDLIKYGFISMPSKCTSTNLPLVDYIKHTYKNEKWINLLDDVEIQPTVLDQATLMDKQRSSYSGSWMGFSEKENLNEYFNKSYFSVVSESRFEDQTDESTGCFYTEKIIRAILYEHPFVLQSVPGALKHLKIAGYKTFDKFWSEDYDSIPDNAERILRITEVVKDICLNKDLDQMSKEWNEIVVHNKKHVHTRVEEFKNYITGLKNEKTISYGT